MKKSPDTSLKMVITDLDGTLLQNDHTISKEDMDTLNLLGEMGICRVAATGRNLFKVRKALSPEAPFDYVICSSGAGIVDWKTQEIIRAIDRHVVGTVAERVRHQGDVIRGAGRLLGERIIVVLVWDQVLSHRQVGIAFE